MKSNALSQFTDAHFSRRSRTSWFGSVVACGFLFACTGTIDDGGTSPNGPSGPNGTAGGSSAGASGAGGAPTTPGTGNAGQASTDTTPGTIDPGAISGMAPSDPNAAGAMPLRYLTSREYVNTVRDLLGDTSVVADDVPSENTDPTFEYFPFRRPGIVGTVEAELLQSAAEKIARNVSSKLGTILPCSASTGETACATQFITTFGQKAYRRPLDAGEIMRLTALYQTARTELALDFNGAVGLLVEALLQSPGFYYHSEKDPGPTELDAHGKARLGPYLLANRLSYFLWGSMPDPALFDAAARGDLGSDSGLEAQVRRMLADPKARDTIADFVDDLLDLDLLEVRPKDAQAYPAYNPALQAAMREEIRRYATNIVFTGTGKLDELFTSNVSSVNQPLALLYGVSGVNGEDVRTATLNPAQRGGLLTLAGFLANTGSAAGSDPPRRGKVLLTRLLCTELPPPPPDVPAPAEPTPGLSTRQRFEQHDANPCATACHSRIDPFGFAFEHYDGIGAYRELDMGVPVNASSSFAFDSGPSVSYANAIELGRALVASSNVRACFTTQWLRYAFRRLESPADLASLQAANAQFVASGNDIRELIVALAKSRTFRFRTPATGEVL